MPITWEGKWTEFERGPVELTLIHRGWYAQNQEDQIIERVLNCQGKLDGYYVDVGAWEPEQDSVTKHFYDNGWHGINIEPHPAVFARLSDARPRDLNLCVAIGDEIGQAMFTAFDSSGLSTLDPDLAEKGLTKFPGRVVQVQVFTLNFIWEQYVKNQPVDFLKIDCEGWEVNVLKGFNLAKYRPRLIVIEALDPGRKEWAYEAWEGVILGAGYKLVETDKVNRYYLATT